METDRREDVMAARAAALARPVAAEDTHDTVEVVTLEVGGAATFAIEARHVREVMRNDHLRRLPGGAGALGGSASQCSHHLGRRPGRRIPRSRQRP